MTEIRRWPSTAVILLATLLAAAVPLVAASSPASASLAGPGATVAMTTPRAMVADPASGDIFVSADDSVFVYAPDGSLTAHLTNVYGASGMAFDGSGSLWVAESTDAKIDQINLSSLTLTNSYATGVTVTGPLVITGGAAWFSSGSNLERFDLSTHATTARGGLPYTGGLLAVPGSPTQLIAYDRGSSPSGAARLNIGVNPATTILTGGVGFNARQLAISSDGSKFWSASGGVYDLPEYATSTMAQDGVIYPGTYYPSAVAYSPAFGGVVAVGTQSTDQLYVSSVGKPVSTSVFSLTGELADSQMSLAPNGSAVYALATASGGYVLDRFSLAPTISFALPSSVVTNVPTVVNVTGTNLGVVSSATVGGVAASTTVGSTTQIQVTMPNGVPTGSQPLVLNTPLGSASTTLTVQANSGATLSGTVRTNGSPLAGAQLQLTGGALGASTVSTTSNASGQYSFTGLGYGTNYVLTVHDPGGTEPDQLLPNITLTPNGTTALDVSMQALPASTTAQLARVTIPGGTARDLVEDPATGRVFVSAGNEIDAFDSAGNLLARFQNQWGASGLAIGGSTLYANLITAGSITKIDIASLTITGSLATGGPTDGALAFAAGKLFFTGGNDQWVGLESLDPATLATSSVAGNWYVPQLGQVADNPNLFTAWTTSQSPPQVFVIDGSTNTMVTTWSEGFGVAGPPAASTGSALLWSADGVERHLADLTADGVTYPANISYPGNGGGPVSYSTAHGGVLDFGSDVDLQGTPSIAATLPDSPTQSAFDSGGNHLAYTTSTGSLVIWDLHPYVSSVGPSPLYTDATSAIVTGTGLGSTTAVSIDGSSTGFTVASSTQVNVSLPVLSAGTHSLTVTTRWGTSAPQSFTVSVRPPAPTVTGVAPSSVPTSGGSVVITGTHLSNATAVALAGVAPASFHVVSDTEIDAVAGPHQQLSGTVAVTTAGGTNATSPTFGWVAPVPVVTSLSPASASTAGGVSVTIHGSGFAFATGVTFGSTGASFTVNSDTTITATAPAHTAGSVNATVTTAGGTSAPSAGSAFSYVSPAPSITSLSPNSGLASGGYQVLIGGTGFTGATSVLFGSLPASSFVVVNDSSIVAVAPAQAPATVVVSVTTPVGTSAGSSPSWFTYTPVPSGTISGTVSSSAGPLANMVVVVSPASSFTVLQTATTAGDGSFSFSGLPVGNYRILTLDPGIFLGASTYYLSQWYDHGGASVTDFGTATTVPVTAGHTTTLNPIVLTSNNPGSIAGTVASIDGPLNGMFVSLYNTASSAPVAYTTTDASGHYSFTGLAPGQYRLGAGDFAQVLGGSSYYVSQFYNGGGPLPTGWSSATNIPVAAGSSNTLGTITLTYNHPGSITGTVGNGGSPLANMFVVVYSAKTDQPVGNALTDGTGHFAVGGLPPGTYKVAVVDIAQLLGSPSYYISQFYKNAGPAPGGLAGATVVTVAGGAATALDPIVLVHN